MMQWFRRKIARSKERDIAEGSAAAALLRDETLKGAFDAIRQECAERWRKADTTEERERWWYQLQAVDFVQGQLALVVKRAEVAASAIEAENADMKKRRDRRESEQAYERLRQDAVDELEAARQAAREEAAA